MTTTDNSNTSLSSSQRDVLFTIRKDGSVGENLPTISNTSPLTTSNSLNEDSSDERPISILSLLWFSGKLGAAIYNIQDKQLSMYNDMVDLQPGFIITRMIIDEVNPSYIITKGSPTDAYVKCVVDAFDSENQSFDSAQIRSLPKNIYLMPKEYSSIACEYKVQSLHLPSEPENATDSERLFYLQSLVDFKSKVSIYALGALIKYTESNWGHFNPECSELTFISLNAVSVKDHLYIDKNTIDALHVFKAVKHDSSFKHGTEQAAGEGWSLYKLISQHCRSSLGTITAKKLLANPINNIDILTKRHEFIDFVNKPANSGFVETLQENMGKISDTTRALTRIQHSRASSSDWIILYKAIYHILFIHEICRPYKTKNAILAEFIDSVTENLYGLQNCINNAVDFKESEKSMWPVIKYGLDKELDAKKLMKNDIRNTVTAAANFAVNQLPDNVDECVVVFIPETGYLVAIKEWEPNCDRYQLESLGFHYLFEMRGMLHYKNAMCKELDLQFGDIHLDIISHQNRIIQRLCGYVVRYNTDIRNPLKVIGLIDCLISMALVSKDKDYIRPKLNTNNIHKILEGKHPLIELSCQNIVPNSFFSGGPHSHAKIITGPNASGKSVFLKQVGIIIFMTHVGMYVPAKEAVIGMTFSMHTRIHSSESAAIRLSAFMMDLAQMSQALNCAKPSSLIMIDEFGRGTTGIEGLALQVGALEKFLNQNTFCPHIVISTHVQQLLTMLPESPILSHMKMDHMQEGQDIVFLYKLIPGVSTSYALTVLHEAGVEATLINRAKEIFDAFQAGIPVKILPQKNEKYNNQSSDFSLADFTVPELDEHV